MSNTDAKKYRQCDFTFTARPGPCLGPDPSLGPSPGLGQDIGNITRTQTSSDPAVWDCFSSLTGRVPRVVGEGVHYYTTGSTKSVHKTGTMRFPDGQTYKSWLDQPGQYDDSQYIWQEAVCMYYDEIGNRVIEPPHWMKTPGSHDVTGRELHQYLVGGEGEGLEARLALFLNDIEGSADGSVYLTDVEALSEAEDGSTKYRAILHFSHSPDT